MSAAPIRDAIAEALARPFPPDVIGWKAQTVSKNGDRALAVPYIDARDVMDRLDQVVGPANWKDEYLPIEGTTNVMCTLSLRLGGEWVPKQDVGGESEQPDGGDRSKAAFSDALKRAAVKWGIGRYLYRLPQFWHAYDRDRKHLVGAPALPDWALPARPAAAPKAAAPSTIPPAPNGEKGVPRSQPKPFHVALAEYGAKLAAEGLCGEGELVRHVASAGKALGYPADMAGWDTAQVEAAREETKAFEASRRPADRAEIDALNALVLRKGESQARLREKLGLAQGQTLSRAHVAEATRLLSPLRDAAEKARS